MIKAYKAPRIFTGQEFLDDHAIIMDGDRVHDVVPVAHLPAGIPLSQYSGSFIAPGFIDIQIYGAEGRLFSAYPTAASLSTLVTHNRESGTLLCLPTIATNTYEVMRQGIDAVRDYWEQGGQGIHGLHLEGPWINPARRGAHTAGEIHVPDLAQVKELLQYGQEVVKMITLAPEQCPAAVLEYIRSKGIVISAGHSDAGYQEAIDAFNQGIPTVTHLFNAMSPLHHRQPGLAGAAMDHPGVRASIIPDGIHVSFAALRIARSVMKQRLFVITDAVTETPTGPYRHQRVGDHFEHGGILSGSALTMIRAVSNLVQQAGVPLEEALRMCSAYPAELLGIGKQYGSIMRGQRNNFIVISDTLDHAEAMDDAEVIDRG